MFAGNDDVGAGNFVRENPNLIEPNIYSPGVPGLSPYPFPSDIIANEPLLNDFLV